MKRITQSLLGAQICKLGQGKKVRVVPNTFSASDFICQRLDMLSSYEQLLNDMNSFYRNSSEGHTNQTTIGNLSDQSDSFYKQDPMDSLEIESAKKNPQKFLIGGYYAVLIKKTWHRCVIIDIDSNQKSAHIECVDDCRTLRVDTSNVKELYSNFRDMKKFAFRCKLSGLDSSKLLTFNTRAIENFKKIISEENKELEAEIVEVKEEEENKFEYEINLYIDDRNIIDWLREMPKE